MRPTLGIPIIVCLSIFACILVNRPSFAGADSTEDVKEARRIALSKLNPLIGQWRGVGRPQRYRTAGTWREKADWVWGFETNGPTFKCTVADGKELKAGEISWDPKKKRFTLRGEHSTGFERNYHGSLDGKKLTLTSEPDRDGDVYRFQITMLNPKRTLVLFQKQKGGKGRFARVHEVGYTREGTRLAKDTLGGPECVVTGGLGTIKVSHKNKSYFVCCTGCRDVFNEDPEGTLADYRKRVAKREAQEREDAAAEKRLLSGSDTTTNE